MMISETTLLANYTVLTVETEVGTGVRDVLKHS